MTPAEIVIQKFGGVSVLADKLGVRAASISYWQTRGNGRIPSKWQSELLRLAHKNNIPLSAADLIGK